MRERRTGHPQDNLENLAAPPPCVRAWRDVCVLELGVAGMPERLCRLALCVLGVVQRVRSRPATYKQCGVNTDVGDDMSRPPS